MIFKLAALSILRRPLRYLLITLLIALAAALPVFIIQLTSGLYNGLNRAVEPFPIVAGAKGSEYQLVLNTVFLRDRPLGNIPYQEVEKLRESGKVNMVLPLAFGDNYRGFRIVGTEPEIFDYVQNKKHGPWLKVAEGQKYSAERDAVIGAETARLTGLKIGDSFKSVHGLAGTGAGHAHEHPYKVVGILAPVGGPYDTSIIVDIHDIWEAHGGGNEHTEAEEHKDEHKDDEHTEAAPAAKPAEKPVRKGGIIRPTAAVTPAPAAKAEDHHEEDEHDHEHEDEHEHEHEHALAPGQKGDVTAILIQPKGYADAMKLLAEYQNKSGSDVQLVFPSRSIISLYGMVGQSREFWQFLTAGLIAAAILITLLVMYWSGLARLREFALIRALGAGTGTVCWIMAAEQCMILAIGSILGWLIGWGGTLAAAHAVAGNAAIVMTTNPELMSFLPPAVILVLGTIASIIPSWLVRKKDVSKYL